MKRLDDIFSLWCCNCSGFERGGCGGAMNWFRSVDEQSILDAYEAKYYCSTVVLSCACRVGKVTHVCVRRSTFGERVASPFVS